MMTTVISQIFTKVTDYKTPTRTFYATKLREPTNSFTRRYVCCCYHRQGFRLGFETSGKLLFIQKKDRFDDKIKKKRVVVVRFNNLGGGGGGRDDGGTGRVLGNLALAIGLTYLSVTGQLGWILDAIVSVWLLVVLVPIVGFGALIWWAGRDVVQSSVRLVHFVMTNFAALNFFIMNPHGSGKMFSVA